MPDLIQLQKKYMAGGVEIVTVAVGLGQSPDPRDRIGRK